MPVRAVIRKAAIDQDVWRACAYGTITAASRDSVTDVNGALGYGGESREKFNNRRLYMPAVAATTDKIRLIKEFEGERRRLVHAGPDFSATPIAGEAYEIHAIDPDFLNRSLNRALTRRCFSVQRTDIECDGSSFYTIGTAPFDTLSDITESADQQILDIEIVSGTDPNAVIQPWDRDGRVYWGELDNNVLGVRFDPAPSGTIRVIWKKPYAAMDDEADVTTCPTAYAMWAMLYETYASLEERAITNHESADELRRLKLDFEARMMREQVVAMGRYAGRIRRQRRSRVRRRAPSHAL